MTETEQDQSHDEKMREQGLLFHLYIHSTNVLEAPILSQACD